MNDPKADAALYLLTGLIQRIAMDKPEIVSEMLDGIKSDQASLPNDVPNKDHVDAIFTESIKVLERMNSLGSGDDA